MLSVVEPFYFSNILAEKFLFVIFLNKGLRLMVTLRFLSIVITYKRQNDNQHSDTQPNDKIETLRIVFRLY
jgi:hypothetical protein